MNAPIRPPSLRPGDTIAIVPTARAVPLDELHERVALADSWGLRVKHGAGLGRKHFHQAGTAEERAADLQATITDPEVRAIWCARGGYGTVQLLPHLDLAPMRSDPKWIAGFSDITVLHSALHRIGVCSLHAQMPFMIGAKSVECKETLRQALFSDMTELSSGRSTHMPGAEGIANRIGQCEGLVVGGNLSVLLSLRGTQYDLDTHGKILVLEDLDELLYHMDRMVMNLKLGGWFDAPAGVIIGGMSDMRDKDESDPFGRSAMRIIADALGDANYPVCFDFPCGHIVDNRAVVLGAKAKLSVAANGATLSSEAAVA